MSRPVPSRPAAGARTQVGTSLPSASICSLWAEQLACADLESDFSQTFWPVDVSGGVIVSRWLSECLLILLWGKGGQLAQTPKFSEFQVGVFFFSYQVVFFSS